MQSMEKESLVLTLSTLVLGAFCVLLRWLQLMNVFEEETGLVRPGSVLNWLLTVALLGAVAVIFFLCRMLRRFEISAYPEVALADPPKVIVAALAAAAMLAAAGSVIYFFTIDTLSLRLTSLLTLLAVPTLLLYPYFPNWGALGAWMSLTPLAAYLFWLVAAYRICARDPVLWSYAPLMLAISAVLYAAFQLAAYEYYRAKPLRTIFACCQAALMSVTVMMDSTAGAARLILLGWGLGLLAVAGLLVLNMHDPRTDEDNVGGYV